MKKYFKSKTINFGLFVTALGAVQVSLPNVQLLFTPEAYGITTAIIGVVVIILRAITTQGIADK